MCNKECLECNKDISNKPRSKYCSRKCIYRSKIDKKIKICENIDCNKILINKNKNAKFCSKSCKGHQNHLSRLEYKNETKKTSYRKCENINCSNNVSHMKVSTKYCSRVCGKKVRRLEHIKIDNTYLFKSSISCSIKRCFVNKKMPKILKSYDILGCTIDEFKIYIENQFETWMTWDNRGLYNGELNYGWDLDHKIPSSLAITIEEIILLNHYTNFQPLCSYTNRVIKSNKLDYPKI